MRKVLDGPREMRIDYLGPGPEAGPLPAFFYIALSGAESLDLHPYNQPVQYLENKPLRVFSLTIPGHEEGLNKFHAMQYWADQMQEGNYILETFFEKVTHVIEWLIEQQIVDPAHMAVGGLSRGGFIAAHIAAREQRMRALLGFAPLTDLLQLSEFSHLPRRAEELNLIHLTELLTHIKAIRFYIGNRDTRVGTDACFHLIRRLADKQHEKKNRHQHVELMITQCIGQHGHGTTPSTFKEGALWIEHHLLGSEY